MDADAGKPGANAKWTAPLRRMQPAAVPVGVALAAKVAMVAIAFALLDGRPSLLADMATKWDGEHYLYIARHGLVDRTFYFAGAFASSCRDTYSAQFPDVQPCGSAHFGFLYPWSMRLFGAGDWSGLVASNVASLAAVAVVAVQMGRKAATFLALFPPFLVFGSVGYSEGLFVLCAAAALTCMQKARTSAASGAASGFAAALAVATRYLGGPALAVASLPWGAWRSWRRWVPTIAVGLAGLGFLLWFWWYTGDPTGYVYAQKPWGSTFGTPVDHFDFLLHGWFTNQGGGLANGNLGPFDYAIRDGLFLIPFVWGLTLLWRQRPDLTLFAYSATVGALAILATSTPAAALPRYLVAGYPALAVVGNRLSTAAAWTAYAAAGIILGASGLAHHVVQYWS